MAHALTAVLTVSFIIVDNGRVLILREKKPEGLRYASPGGHIEMGESVEAAAKREALEETGLQVEVGALVQVLTRVWEDGHHSVRQTYTANKVGGELALEEGVESSWMTQEEIEAIPDDQWNFASKEAILLALAGKTIDSRHVVWKV